MLSYRRKNLSLICGYPRRDSDTLRATSRGRLDARSLPRAPRVRPPGHRRAPLSPLPGERLRLRRPRGDRSPAAAERDPRLRPGLPRAALPRSPVLPPGGARLAAGAEGAARRRTRALPSRQRAARRARRRGGLCPAPVAGAGRRRGAGLVGCGGLRGAPGRVLRRLSDRVGPRDPAAGGADPRRRRRLAARSPGHRARLFRGVALRERAGRRRAAALPARGRLRRRHPSRRSFASRDCATGSSATPE